MDAIVHVVSSMPDSTIIQIIDICRFRLAGGLDCHIRREMRLVDVTWVVSESEYMAMTHFFAAKISWRESCKRIWAMVEYPHAVSS